MSVTSANKYTTAQTRADSTTRSYVITYKVVTDDKNDGPITARNGILAEGTTYSYGNDSDAFAAFAGYGAIRLQEEGDSWKVWQADVMFSTQPPESCTLNIGEDPLNAPPIISFGGVREQRIADKDRLGALIVNAAGDPRLAELYRLVDPYYYRHRLTMPKFVLNAAGDQFDDLFRDDTRQELVIQLNQPSYDPLQMDEFTDSVNAGSFFGLDKRKWKMEAPRAVTRYQANCNAYFQVTYRFLSNNGPHGWDAAPANRGFRVRKAAGVDDWQWPKETADGKLRAIPPAPVALSVDGTQRAFGGDIIFYDGTEPTLEPDPGPWEIYEEKDFGLLGIPTSL